MSGAITARSTKKGEAVDRGRFRTSPKGVTDLPPVRVPWEASSDSSEVVRNTLGIIAGRFPGMKGSHVSAELGNIVPSVFTPVLAKHSKSFSLIDCISVGVDRMQRNFEPMRKQVEAWQRSELTDVTAKVVIYEAFVEGKLEAPKHLARAVHDLYFEPKYEEFRPRTIWSLSNAFTSAFKELDPIPQFKATAKLGEFLEARFSQSF
jgi:hypothetical protein